MGQLFVLVFFTWRIIDISIAYLLDLIIKPTPTFSFHLYHKMPHFLHFLVPFANYDGAIYLNIAHDGYGTYQQAFFPLYPLIIHYIVPFFSGMYFINGFIIANLAFVGGLYFFIKFLKHIGSQKHEIIFTILFLLTFPTSFFFGAVYTEGLFFFFFSTSLYFLTTKQYYKGAFFGLFAGLTRLIGVFITILGIVTWYFTKRYTTLPQKRKSRFTKEKLGELFFILTPLLGIGSYMYYLKQTTGNFLAFYSAQPQFHQNRSSHLIFLPQVYYRYVNIFFHTKDHFSLFIALLEFIVFNFMIIVVLYDLYQLFVEKRSEKTHILLGLNIFSLLNLLLPSLTGTLVSVPRYALFSLSVFIRLSRIQSLKIKLLLLFIFGLLHIILLTLFLWGHFVS